MVKKNESKYLIVPARLLLNGYFHSIAGLLTVPDYARREKPRSTENLVKTTQSSTSKVLNGDASNLWVNGKNLA